MSDHISFLPEEERIKEEALRTGKPAPAPDTRLRFTVPQDSEEDVEVIEIDEGEMDEVLSHEPFLSRVMYRGSALLDKIKATLFQPQIQAPPPKLPPQFFATSKSKESPDIQEIPAPEFLPRGRVQVAAPIRPRVQIKPYAKTPGRVRVIRRVRKPLHVSFVTDADLQYMRIDLSKRKFTLVTLLIAFTLLISGGWYFLRIKGVEAVGELAKAEAQLVDVRSHISTRVGTWTSFQDLEPRLRALRGLLDIHVSPNRLLGELERVTLDDVSYDSFVLTPDKRMTLHVVASSFASAAGQVMAFQSAPFISRVETSGYTATYDPPESQLVKNVTFQVILTIVPQAFSVPTSTTTL